MSSNDMLLCLVRGMVMQSSHMSYSPGPFTIRLEVDSRYLRVRTDHLLHRA